MTTLVLGASPNPSRYAHMAVLRLRANGHDVIAVGKRSGIIGDVHIHFAIPGDAHVDTVTVYLSPANLLSWREGILALKPRRVIFNPGAEDPSFARQLEETGIQVVDDCTLVMLATGGY